MNPNDPAFPNPEREFHQDHDTIVNKYALYGLTKREYFAAMAMQGLVYRYATNDKPTLMRFAVEYADALIAELSKGGPA